MTEILMSETNAGLGSGCLEHSDLEFVSDFVLRISGFSQSLFSMESLSVVRRRAARMATRG